MPLIVSIQIATRNKARENILLRTLEYFLFLNFDPIKSPNKVHKVKEKQLLIVNIIEIKAILNKF